MVTIENGPFIYGGPGEPRSRYFGELDYTEAEQFIDLPAFAIDRTEVSNAAFKPFGEMANITGYPAPTYGSDGDHRHDAEPLYPVSNVDAFEASAYCEYMGKRLPSEYQWTKASRGGLSLNGTQNPYPRRLYPWGAVLDPACVNVKGDEDGYPWTAPVDSFACGASPYQILNLVGNVQEWIARDGQTDPGNPLYVLRGGMPDSRLEADIATTIFRNHRAPTALYYSNGIRCVIPALVAPP
jgi:formylglycine-generating enzyme required for sulfatase activity